jgi:hypothetical protein
MAALAPALTVSSSLVREALPSERTVETVTICAKPLLRHDVTAALAPALTVSSSLVSEALPRERTLSALPLAQQRDTSQLPSCR